MHEDKPTELEQRALAAWTPAEPPPGFADRVVAAAAVHDAATASQVAGTPRLVARWPRVAAAAIAAAAIAGTVAASFKFWPGPQPSDDSNGRAVIQGGVDDPGSPVDTTRAPEKPNTSAKLEIPADLATRIGDHVASYGAKYGPAFKFQGSLVVARRGEVLYAGHFGRTDQAAGPAIDEHTRFKIGSLTQQFTAVAILQLRDEGALSLDDKVRKHLPDFAFPDVTLRHLLTHTSGVPSYTDGVQIGELKPGTAYPPATIRALFEKSELEFPPGTDFDLSNSGYFVLGLVVEAASKQKLGDFLQRRIFAPAGMTHTSLGGEARVVDGAPVATGHEFSEEERLVPVAGYDLASVYGGAAGMLSTAADLVRWDSALSTPGALLTPASLDEMYTPVREDYGLGWIVTRARGQKFVGHPGGVEGFNGAIARFLGDGVTVFALANTTAVDCRDIVEDAGEILYGNSPPAHVEHDEVPVSKAMFSRYLGDYTLSETSQKKLERLIDPGALGLMTDVRVYDDDGRLFMLIHAHGAKWLHMSAPDQFFFKDTAGTTAQFGPPGAPVQTLTLRQRGLEFILKRAEPGAPRPGIRVTPGPFR